jgi:tRNA(Arg) A34 adenosine deaminase TadA
MNDPVTPSSKPQAKPNASPMQLALQQAVAAAERGEVPVGAVITDAKGYVIAANGNRIIEYADPTAHAEMLVIREATTALKNERLVDCNLYVTLEPCPMCAGAISLARIKRLYYGAADEKAGGAEHGIRLFSHPSCHHRPEVYGGIEEIACATILQSFFANRRQS